MIAVFPGSFDPLTNGHLDLIKRAQSLVDKLIVGIGSNMRKKDAWFPVEERVRLIKQVVEAEGLDRVEVTSFPGLVVDFAHAHGANVLIRGLRAISDFELELQMAHVNRSLANNLETLMLVTSNAMSFISSSMVREVCSHEGKIDTLVPPLIAKALLVRQSLLNHEKT